MNTQPETSEFTSAPPLKRAHLRRLREIYRSAGWPCQDLLEVELLAAGQVERRVSAQGHETLRVTDAGILYGFMVGREPFGFLRLLRIEGVVVNYAGYSAIMGGILAFILFSVSAFSIPLIYDGRAQLVSGVVASVRAVFGRFGVMMCWALLLSGVIIVSTLLLPLLLLTLPVMAYASRELYFRTFPPEAGADIA